MSILLFILLVLMIYKSGVLYDRYTIHNRHNSKCYRYTGICRVDNINTMGVYIMNKWLFVGIGILFYMGVITMLYGYIHYGILWYISRK